jgi:hypothetical protein
MYKVLYDQQSIMHLKFIPDGAIVIKEVLAHLQDILHLKHPKMWVAIDWV